MTAFITTYIGTFFGLVLIIAAHFSVKAVFGQLARREVLLDALAGVAIAYAFIDVFVCRRFCKLSASAEILPWS
jgi:hypothetical protein